MQRSKLNLFRKHMGGGGHLGGLFHSVPNSWFNWRSWSHSCEIQPCTGLYANSMETAWNSLLSLPFFFLFQNKYVRERGSSIPVSTIHRSRNDLIDVAKLLSKTSLTILISIIVWEYHFSKSMSTLAIIKFKKKIFASLMDTKWDLVAMLICISLLVILWPFYKITYHFKCSSANWNHAFYWFFFCWLVLANF